MASKLLAVIQALKRIAIHVLESLRCLCVVKAVSMFADIYVIAVEGINSTKVVLLEIFDLDSISL